MNDYHQRLKAFMRQDRQPIKAEIPAVKGDRTTAVIRLYDPIDSWGGWGGISAKEFATVLDDLPDTITEIRLLVNSPGGEVTEGIAILNALRNHPARVVAVVEGLAASAASFIAAGVDELIVARNTELMCHDAWGLCVGNADDMHSMADLLDHLSDNIASIYAAKAGGTVEEWRAVMAAETWFSAEEAVAAGLADSIIEPPSNDDAKALFDLTIFNYAGRQKAPEPKIPADHPADGSPKPEGGSAVAFSDEQITDLRESLGLGADADEGSILAAVDTLLEQATAPTPTPEPATLPDGVVAISEQQLTDLQADAQAGREARAQQITAERTGLVTAAVRDGRIAPAERDAWLAKLETGTGAETVLATLKPGVIPVDQLGHGGNVDLESDDALFAELFGPTKEVAR